jgi:hypothetical protein
MAQEEPLKREERAERESYVATSIESPELKIEGHIVRGLVQRVNHPVVEILAY